jgi:hypothetical protein
MTARRELLARLALARAVIEDARSIEHSHGLAHNNSRRFAGDILRRIHLWNAAHGGTVNGNVAANAPATGSEAGSSETPDPKEPDAMPVSETFGVRLPADLRADIDEIATAHRLSSGQVIRVAVEQMVEREQRTKHAAEHTPPRTAA